MKNAELRIVEASGTAAPLVPPSPRRRTLLLSPHNTATYTVGLNDHVALGAGITVTPTGGAVRLDFEDYGSFIQQELWVIASATADIGVLEGVVVDEAAARSFAPRRANGPRLASGGRAVAPRAGTLAAPRSRHAGPCGTDRNRSRTSGSKTSFSPRKRTAEAQRDPALTLLREEPPTTRGPQHSRQAKPVSRSTVEAIAAANPQHHVGRMRNRVDPVTTQQILNKTRRLQQPIITDVNAGRSVDPLALQEILSTTNLLQQHATADVHKPAVRRKSGRDSRGRGND